MTRPLWRPVMTAVLIAVPVLSLIPVVGALEEAERLQNFDDAYMFARYAGNILSGFGPAWNPGGEWSYGCTSQAHLLLVTIMQIFTGTEADFLSILLSSALAGAAFLGLLITLALSLTKHWLWEWRLATLLFLPLITYQPVWLFHLRTGMDTMLGMTWATLVSILAVWSRERQQPVLLGAAAALVYLVRPDLSLCLLPLGGLAILLFSEREAIIRNTAIYTGSAVAVLSAEFLLMYLLYSTPLPLPFYVKRGGFYEGFTGGYIWNVVDLFRVAFLMGWPFLMVGALSFRSTNWRLTLVIFLPVLLHVAYLLNLLQIMGDQARFYTPLLGPVTVYAIVSVIEWVDHYKEDSFDRWTGSVRVGAAAVLLFLLPRLAWEPVAAAWHEAHYQKRAADSPPENISWWEAARRMTDFAEGLPEGTRLAASEHGYLGAHADHLIIIDLVALHDREFAFNGFSGERFFARDPDVIWMPESHYAGLRREILDHPDFQNYRFYPEEMRFGVAMKEEYVPLFKDQLEADR